MPAVAAINKKRWVSKVPMESVIEPACQVHHTHRDHWVSTILFNNKIYFLDSLGIVTLVRCNNSRRFKNSVITYIYGRDKKKIYIELPEVMRQNNNVDCGFLPLLLLLLFVFEKRFV